MRSILSAVLVAGSLVVASLPSTASAEETQTKGPLRILHVMSFDNTWQWPQDQLAGFKAALGSDLQVEYKVVELDARLHPEEPAIERHAAEARKIIDEWKPDLVYGSDDNALISVIGKYANTNLPCVFSGVNHSLDRYGLGGARNITGVIEREHFLESVHLLQKLKPHAKRIQVFADRALHDSEIAERLSNEALGAPNVVNIVGIDRFERFAEFKKAVLENANHADAYLLLGMFTFKLDDGHYASFKDVHEFLATQSKVPEIAFWRDRINNGVLGGVVVSGYEQGREAGMRARAILVDGRAPNSLPVGTTQKGLSVINLARAKSLGITPSASLLLSSVVIPNYKWK